MDRTRCVWLLPLAAVFSACGDGERRSAPVSSPTTVTSSASASPTSGSPSLAPATLSVVTTELVDEAGHPTRQALDRVLSLFREQLRP